MGRAQVMQAEAAGIKPSVLMNPILLKPTNDVGSQVIVNGEVLGTMSARDYFKYKKKLVPDIMKAYDKLASENDIIVISCAKTPPLSISPTRSTGAFAIFAIPIFTISSVFRLISAGLPAPSITMISFSDASYHRLS